MSIQPRAVDEQAFVKLAIQLDIGSHLLSEEPAVWKAALWTWTVVRLRYPRRRAETALSGLTPSAQVLDRIVDLWEKREKSDDQHEEILSVLCSTLLGLPRNLWTPKLSEGLIKELREYPGLPESKELRRSIPPVVSCFVAFHSKEIWPDKELARRLSALRKSDRHLSPMRLDGVDDCLRQMGTKGASTLTIGRDQKGSRPISECSAPFSVEAAATVSLLDGFARQPIFLGVQG